MPSAAHGLTWRPLTGDDLDLWHALVEHVQNSDKEKERVTHADLRDYLTRQTTDLTRNTLIGLDQDGAARAWGRVTSREGERQPVLVHVTGGVDPGWRGRGIGREVLAWQLVRARELAAQRREQAGAAGQPAPTFQIGRFVEEQHADRRALVVAAGLRPVRWYTELRRPLAGVEDQGDRRLGASYELRPYAAVDPARVVEAFNLAFAGQWGTPLQTDQSWAAQVDGDEAFRPEQSRVIVDTALPEEPVVGFVINAEYVEDWPQYGYTEGYTEYLGVIPSAQGRGLGRMLLDLSAVLFADRGHPYATLAFDTGNPTSAGRLYESVGYQKQHTTVFHAIDA